MLGVRDLLDVSKRLLHSILLHIYTNTKSAYNIYYFLFLTSIKIPKSYMVTLKLTSERKTDVR